MLRGGEGGELVEDVGGPLELERPPEERAHVRRVTCGQSDGQAELGGLAREPRPFVARAEVRVPLGHRRAPRVGAAEGRPSTGEDLGCGERDERRVEPSAQVHADGLPVRHPVRDRRVDERADLLREVASHQ